MCRCGLRAGWPRGVSTRKPPVLGRPPPHRGFLGAWIVQLAVRKGPHKTLHNPLCHQPCCSLKVKTVKSRLSSLFCSSLLCKGLMIKVLEPRKKSSRTFGEPNVSFDSFLYQSCGRTFTQPTNHCPTLQFRFDPGGKLNPIQL